MRARAIRRCGRASRVFAALLDAAAARHESSSSGQGRRAARRLSRDLAKALNDERDVVRGESESQPSAGDASARRSLPAAQRNPDGQLHLRRHSEERRHDRRRNSRRRMARGERFMSPEVWSARRRRLTGRRSMPPTSSTCTAAVMKSAVTPSRTSGPAISMQRSLAAEIERNRRYLRVARSLDQDRELRLPVRLRVVRAQAAAQGQRSSPAAASCRA